MNLRRAAGKEAYRGEKQQPKKEQQKNDLRNPAQPRQSGPVHLSPPRATELLLLEPSLMLILPLDCDLYHQLASMAGLLHKVLAQSTRQPVKAHSRLMSEAMHAAPKPLSMLTTETLGEQVFNIPNSAAMPDRKSTRLNSSHANISYA